jgi:DNA (cytosine-5)-methyltransferase 1
VELHPGPLAEPIPCGDSLVGCSTPREQLEALLSAAAKYRSFKYWDKVRMGSSESRITGQGFNAVKFDPRKPARTVRRNDGNLGMHGAMHWSERRRFSLPEFKRFSSFPDSFLFAGEFEEGIKQIGNCVPPVFMKAIAESVRYRLLPKNGYLDNETDIGMYCPRSSKGCASR